MHSATSIKKIFCFFYKKGILFKKKNDSNLNITTGKEKNQYFGKKNRDVIWKIRVVILNYNIILDLWKFFIFSLFAFDWFMEH